MKKFVAYFVFLVVITVGAAGIANAGIFDPKRHSLCYDESGKFDPQDKSCDPNSCGCLFHQIGEIFIGIFD